MSIYPLGNLLEKQISYLPREGHGWTGLERLKPEIDALKRGTRAFIIALSGGRHKYLQREDVYGHWQRGDPPRKRGAGRYAYLGRPTAMAAHVALLESPLCVTRARREERE